ncbi:hypothetical protein BMS3Bbin14_00376 [bacterium BMS3Bbin14]|nr:hypothetical protein BMS3Abin13_00823 [bacterium BMS3Abin13]GBE51918.1 hypothetical protein BMS3Bbin14_00376 [bacterium BMS3Bbin14]HDK44007.1 hypothetical protein [Desulfobacteraceae bacterium]HDO30026.1 hypothetical protein [Desulfobacteraceae bacterium]
MKRSAELQKILLKIGLSYQQDISTLPEYIVDNGFLLFSSFHVQKQHVLLSCFKNVFMGNFKRFHLFFSDFNSDYSIDDNAQGYKQTIAVLQSTSFSLPRFCLLPKSTERFTVKLDHLGQDFMLPIFKGYKKRPFPGYPRLKRKYTLKSPVMPTPENLFGTGFMAYLDDHPGWFMEGNNNALLLYRRGRKIKPYDICEFIEDAVEIGHLLAPNTRKS